MKAFLDVEQTRRDNFLDGQSNSVHRSSLLVPVLPNSEVSISFLNHFLIKRNIVLVGCKVTAIDDSGEKISSRLTQIDEPRVYTLHLQRDSDPKTNSFLIEFFSADNLVIPFPAVMINHRQQDCLSTVHSYNRVLADVFEDDDVNSIQVLEAGIDMSQDPSVSTFFCLQAGPFDLTGPVTLEFSHAEGLLQHTFIVNVPRYTYKFFKLDELVPTWPKRMGTLKIKQPDQKLFYGRLLVGQHTQSGSFVANHSYYDNSGIEGEFWDNNIPSHRTYPVIEGLQSLIRFYPIMSPSTLDVRIIFNSAIGEILSGELVSPGSKSIELDIESLAVLNGFGIQQAKSFTVVARSMNGNTPTRINHQLIYKISELESSINISLYNSNVFHPKGKSRTAWGQLIHSNNYHSWLSISNDGGSQTDSIIRINFYDESGLIFSTSLQIACRSARTVRVKELLGNAGIEVNGEYLWYEFESDNHLMTGFSIAQNTLSNHCIGEHSF
jgi:hypothetical protein